MQWWVDPYYDHVRSHKWCSVYRVAEPLSIAILYDLYKQYWDALRADALEMRAFAKRIVEW